MMPQGPHRVAILIDSLIAGGAERVAVDGAAALDRTRFEPLVIVGRHTGPLEARLVETGVPYTILGRTRTLSPRALAAAGRHIRASDIVHAHKYAGSAVSAVLTRIARRPLITHEHTWNGAGSRSMALTYRMLIGPSARVVICVSEGVAAAVAGFGVPRDKIVVIHNGVALDGLRTRRDARLELGLAPEAVVVGIIARLRAEKRHDLAIRAIARLRDEGIDVQLCVIGDGPCAPELRALATSLDVSDRVLFAGERQNAGTFAPALDVGLLCSDWEGLPLAALEILGAGVPLVATEVGALPALLRDGAGMIVPPGDVPEIARAIAALVGEPTVAAAMGERGRGLVTGTFGIATMARHIEAIYERELASGRGGRNDTPF
jgi:glycosyltransferase involved in cell wall biosynthesis